VKRIEPCRGCWKAFSPIEDPTPVIGTAWRGSYEIWESHGVRIAFGPYCPACIAHWYAQRSEEQPVG
jgi:hypothetical protein